MTPLQNDKILVQKNDENDTTIHELLKTMSLKNDKIILGLLKVIYHNKGEFDQIMYQGHKNFQMMKNKK